MAKPKRMNSMLVTGHAGAKAATEYIPTRQSLLSRLKNWNDHESWSVFFETYWKLIYNTAVKAGLTDAEAQDVVQETVISVMKSMPDFKYDAKNGSFKAWLLRLTSWRTVDQFRKRQRNIEVGAGAGGGAGDDAVENVADPATSKLEAVWDEEWERNLIDAAIEKVKTKVDPKQYQIFDLYVFRNWSVLRVARFLNINPGHVYLIKHRITKLIKSEVQKLRLKPI